MSAKEVAAEMAKLFQAGDHKSVGERYWAEDAVSIEAQAPNGMDPVSRGRQALEAKSKWWNDNHEVLNGQVEGPFVNGDQAAFRFEMDVKVKASGEVMHMAEIALYTIRNDNIVEERFLYGG